MKDILDSEVQAEIELKLGYEFKNKDLLVEALTHRSLLNENSAAKTQNERLEYVGDAVLELAVREHGYRKHPEWNEGDLTKYSSMIVRGENLFHVAQSLGLEDYIRLSKGAFSWRGTRDLRRKGKLRRMDAFDWILANAVEALIASIYFDGGLGEAKFFVDAHVLHATAEQIRDYRDWKSELQDTLQALTGITPAYEVISNEGPDHERLYVVWLFAGETKLAEGSGHSKQDAQINAARNGMASIDEWSKQLTLKPSRPRQNRRGAR